MVKSSDCIPPNFHLRKVVKKWTVIKNQKKENVYEGKRKENLMYGTGTALLTVSSVPEMTVWAEEMVTPGEVMAEEITIPEEADRN